MTSAITTIQNIHQMYGRFGNSTTCLKILLLPSRQIPCARKSVHSRSSCTTRVAFDTLRSQLFDRPDPTSFLTSTMTTSSIISSQPWWKETIVYQIYPASYLALNPTSPPNDTQNTVGNISGIISKVPYIASLGFDAIWLSPIFSSPQKDMGYDISDYRKIHAPYGTVEDVQKLIDVLHSTHVSDGHGGKRKMRLLMDLVVNHTSDEHPWFKESATSRDNAKSDWYFWRDPKILPDGTRTEPTNWRSIFGGSAWNYLSSRKQYYLALFLPSQPDLNWENAEMRQATYDDMRWWLDRGVDGFRIDSMNLMSKDPGLPDAEVTEPDEKYQNGSKYYASGPKMHDYLQEIRKEVFDRYGETFTVGEMGSVDTEESVAQYVAKERRELNCVFHGMDLDFGPAGKYDGSDPFSVAKLRHITKKWHDAMPKFDGWNTVYLDNHDSGRSLSRYTSDEPRYREVAAKMLATYLSTLSGTPFILSGQEIGMANLGTNVGIEDYIDVEGSNWYQKIQEQRGKGADMSDVMQQLQLKARDHGRLPMQWSDDPNAGFCPADHKPWMTVNPDYTKWNVSSQVGQKESILEYWKAVIEFRRQQREILVYGDFEMLPAQETTDDVIGYERSSGSKLMVVLLNFSKEVVSLSGAKYAGFSIAMNNMSDAAVTDLEISLRPYEAIVLSGQKASPRI